jgi:hypothetical protein
MPDMTRTPPSLPPGWRMKTCEVIPGLLIGTRLAPAATFHTLGVDAIVDLADWALGWGPRCPPGVST